MGHQPLSPFFLACCAAAASFPAAPFLGGALPLKNSLLVSLMGEEAKICLMHWFIVLLAPTTQPEKVKSRTRESEAGKKKEGVLSDGVPFGKKNSEISRCTDRF
jgi:hypothetical protein